MGESNAPGRPDSKGSVDVLQPGSAAPITQTSTAESLTPAQLHAAFDILTHHQTYAEVESFKDPATISSYGFPFTLRSSSESSGKYAARSSVPLLSSFLRRVVLPLPGIKDLPPDFWSVRLQGILEKLAQAELSESYDKGALGTRKTLATAASAVHEYVSRGGLGGFPAGPKRDLHAEYDTTDAADLTRAWEDGVHELVYGNLIDELCDCIIETDSLEHHSPAVRAASEYVHIHLATFMHYVFVLSTEGQYLLKLVENMHQLIPYSMIKQTLRIGNAATMMNGMIKLLLAKMSVGSLTNWMGLTQNADDGVNLLQRIITLVLSWDSSDFRKAVERVEKAKDGPLKEHLAVIKQHIQSSREEHEEARTRSREDGESIVITILKKNRPDLVSKLSESNHTQLLDFYSAILSVRDREEITKVLCRQNPDLFTQALRDTVSAFDPMIRTAHENLEIREHLAAMEVFLNDFIRTSKPKSNKKGDSVSQPPSVEDYVRLLRRNDNLLYSWLHQFATKCPELRESFRAWAKGVIKTFRQDTRSNTVNSQRSQGGSLESRQSGAGDMSAAIQDLYTGLPAAIQEEVTAALNSHVSYLTNLERLSNTRMQTIIDNLAHGEQIPPSKSGTSTPKRSGTGFSTRSNTPAPSTGTVTPNQAASMAGPGIFLCRWQSLLDQTIVTPATPKGQPRTGKQIKGNTTMGKTGAEASRESWDSAFLARQVEKDVPDAPDVDAVLKALLPGFRKLLAENTKTSGRS